MSREGRLHSLPMFKLSPIFLMKRFVNRVEDFLEKHGATLLVLCLSVISAVTFVHFYQTGLGLTYNDARSHLDIGRRVVEGLTPGLAQLGSVWLPLPHLLMILTVWNDLC